MGVILINNYKYFLVLAQELNISRAAQRVFISHQALSAYLKNLENEFGVNFFNRKPTLSLTPAGEVMLESLNKISLIEKNFLHRIADIRSNGNVTITIGLTEGRYRILAPSLLKKVRSLCPNIQLVVISDTSLSLKEKLLNNELDLFLAGSRNIHSSKLQIEPILEEKLYLVISDTMIQHFFPESYPQCKDNFARGVDLRNFKKIPFILNKIGYNSRTILDTHLKNIDAELNVIMEYTQPDIHHLLSSVDIAASFCLSMYINKVKEINLLNNGISQLNIFPVLDLKETNTISIVYLKDSIFSKSTQTLIDLLKNLCVELSL